MHLFFLKLNSKNIDLSSLIAQLYNLLIYKQTYKMQRNRTLLGHNEWVSAIVSKDHQTINKFLDFNAIDHVNCQDIFQNKTAIMMAAATDNVELFNALMSHNADLLMVDMHKNNVLHYAMDSENPLAYKSIVNKSPELLAMTNNQGQTPLHLLILLSQSYTLIEIMQLMIDSGAPINVQDTAGNTPIIYVANYIKYSNHHTRAHDFHFVMRMLIQAGASTDPKDPNGKLLLNTISGWNSNTIKDSIYLFISRLGNLENKVELAHISSVDNYIVDTNKVTAKPVFYEAKMTFGPGDLVLVKQSGKNLTEVETKVSSNYTKKKLIQFCIENDIPYKVINQQIQIDF